jgi:hypothetical protein
MAVMAFEAIIQYCEGLTNQLEGLRYTKQAALASKIVGGLDAAIYIAGISGDQWNKRAQTALLEIMKDKPSTVKMNDMLPDAIVNATKTPLPETPAAAGCVKLPVI